MIIIAPYVGRFLEVMATLHFPAPSSHSAGAVRRIYSGTQAALSFDGFFPARCTSTSVAHLNIRIENEARTKVKERRCPIFAAKTNPPEESNIAKTSDTARGPPFLTILAGFVVFFGIIWILGSIVVWLFSFLVRPSH